MRASIPSSEQLITAIFWEAFTAVGAATALSRTGLPDENIAVIGLLDGRVPDMREFLANIGLPEDDVVYYDDCFEDGAVLLLIRAAARQRPLAIDLIRRYGGIFPPSHILETAHAGSKTARHPQIPGVS